MKCPYCSQELEEVLVSFDNVPVSFICRNESCRVFNTELYRCVGDKLLTRTEFFELREEMNG